jgi:hypothetical protein
MRRTSCIEPLLNRLAAYNPEVITVEGLGGEECDTLGRFKPENDKAYKTYCFDTAERGRLHLVPGGNSPFGPLVNVHQATARSLQLPNILGGSGAIPSRHVVPAESAARLTGLA